MEKETEEERERERFGKREIDRKRVRVCVRESMCIFYVRTCVYERERDEGRKTGETKQGGRDGRERERTRER